MSNLSQKTTVNVQEKANMIWNIADIIRGTFKPHEYGKVILPMTVLKRLNDTLLPTKQKVLEAYKEYGNLEVNDGFFRDASGYSFYNTSPFTFETLLNDSDHIEENFRKFMAGFSENIQDILKNFKFDHIISDLVGSTADEDKLFYVIQEFNKPSSYMGPDVISTTDMGYIFEELIRKFSESYNEEAGAHFTARDIIYLMADLLVTEENAALTKGKIDCYDMAMGTSQMLTCLTERILQLDSEVEINVFGQEVNPETFAIAKADMIIRGGVADNMRFGNTLTNDQFKGYQFDYCISNPPFGVEWKPEKSAVEKEHKNGDKGRFGVGLPKISDGQMLFTLNGISKLKDTGRLAIIHNGSPLFTGDAGSGPSEIRKYIIENDWLDAIVQLPNDLFYNTGITTYVWIISKNKSDKRKGKVQLIDASNMYEKRRKSIGNKRVDLSEDCRKVIVQAYGEFTDKYYDYGEKSVESKVFNNEDFGFYKITVESPLKDDNGKIVMKKGKSTPDTSKRDTENVPLTEDIEEYFKREVLPYNSEAWIDEKKTTIGYEIPFTRHFYKYVAPEQSDAIAERICTIEAELTGSLKSLFGKNGE
ncbi:type I restriction-modification system subunit M [Methanococcus maripaludis]|uniref:site-specific DNA-methyltransferase (adenine-specific) n=1 Tax=Methanococcus maripaludis TaxID=39152 RepID=A0A8T4CNU2_METMI|nr:class I SAM-dependent DNA methyltransferase [Methanococcus maripaludis]MBM7408743.1 type I restriction enzyme M protein [Methanococcus maripaludis]MBP2219088.1 type I restriction enzyme M protein [Methanococcus maripaludis]